MNHYVSTSSQRLFFLCAAAMSLTLGANAQVITSGLTLEEYVNDVLLGNGVQATNITYTGGASQLGHMTEGGDTFSVAEGLVLSSDNALNLGCEAGGGCIDCLGMGFNDADLLSVANSVPPMIGQNFSVSSVNDGCVLEFDFVAAGDTVSFNYVFGSDEYLTWINSSYNDVFAFFLSGPGITGPYASPAAFPGGAVNIAAVPDTDPALPITISSVNPQINDAYYIDNPGSVEAPCINGYTVPFTAWHQVECGETYHIKLAIADGSDTALESIVVLEAGSFQSNAVVQIDLTIDVGGPDANTIYEDCGTATLTFERPIETILELQEMVYIDYSNSTAINGVDYGQPQPDGSLIPLPDSVVFEPFVSSVSFDLVAAIDGFGEGDEVVEMVIDNVAACNGGGLETFFTFIIAEEPPPFVVSGYSTEACLGFEQPVSPIVEGGYGNYTYLWDCSDETTGTLIITPDDDWSCFVTVGDTCGLESQTVEIEVEILEFPPFEVELNPEAVELTCGGNALVTAIASGGNGPSTGGSYTYDWFDQDEGNLPPMWWSPGELTLQVWQGVETLFVTVTDACGFEETASIEVTYDIPELIVDLNPVLEVLCNEDYTVGPSVTGQGPFSYQWFENGANTWNWNQNYTGSTDADLELEVLVTDACSQEESVVVSVEVTAPDVVVVMPTELIGPCTTEFEVEADVTSGSGGYSYAWYQDGELVVGESNSMLVVESFVDTEIEVVVNDGCGQVGFSATDIIIDNPPLVIELGDPINASCVDNTTVEVDILSGAGEYEYAWSVDGEAYSSDEDILVQSYFTIPIAVSVTDGCGGAASDDVAYIIPNVPLEIGISDDVTICAGDGISVEAFATGGEDGFVYYWPTLNAYGPTQYLTPTQSAVYPVVATDICGWEVDSQTEVAVQYLFSNFTVSMITQTEAQFTATPSPEEPFEGAFTYNWNFGDGVSSSEQNPRHEYDGLQDYTASLEVVSWIGCRDSAYTNIPGPVNLYVPSAFTPNNDGLNDAFFAHMSGVKDFEIWVFNRWGEQVFHSQDPAEVWIGEVSGGDYYAPNGVYNWVVRLKGFNTDAQEFMGTVQLMR